MMPVLSVTRLMASFAIWTGNTLTTAAKDHRYILTADARKASRQADQEVQEPMANVHLDESQLDEMVSQVATKLISSRGERTSWERRIQVTIGVTVIITAIFSLGINWSRIDTAETKITAAADERRELSQRLAKVELSIIAQEGSSNLITQQLDTIQNDVKEIKSKIYK